MNMLSQLDSGLLASYQQGLVVGLVVLTTLVLFPGREPNWEDRVNNNESAPEANVDTTTATTTGAASSRPGTETNNSNKRQPSHDPGDEHALTPQQKMNYTVHAILIVGTLVILDFIYGGFIRVWLRINFPRELSVFGYEPIV